MEGVEDSYTVMVRRLRFLALSLVVALSVGDTQAKEMADPLTPAERAELEELRRWAALLEQAEQGDPRAQFVVGERYDVGQGIPQDDAEAVRWYR